MTNTQTTDNQLSAFYFDENGQKHKFNSQEIFIELSDGQVLSVSKAHKDPAIVISESRETELSIPDQVQEFTVLTMVPRACNVVEIKPNKYSVTDYKG